jgi:hypothetical protein
MAGSPGYQDPANAGSRTSFIRISFPTFVTWAMTADPVKRKEMDKRK